MGIYRFRKTCKICKIEFEFQYPRCPEGDQP